MSNLNDEATPATLATWAARNLPARLDVKATARLLGFAEHDIQILMGTGKLEPLGEPAPNAPKWFCAIEIIRLATDRDWLHKATREISKHWRQKREHPPKVRAMAQDQRPAEAVATLRGSNSRVRKSGRLRAPSLTGFDAQHYRIRTNELHIANEPKFCKVANESQYCQNLSPVLCAFLKAILAADGMSFSFAEFENHFFSSPHLQVEVDAAVRWAAKASRNGCRNNAGQTLPCRTS